MPLLADAYADAHLNTATLDKDITAALKKLEAAMKRFDKVAKVTLRLDTNTANVRLREFLDSVNRTRKEIEANAANLRVEVDDRGLEDVGRRVQADVQDSLPQVQLPFQDENQPIVPQGQLVPEITGQGSLFDTFDEIEEQLALFDDPVDIPVQLSDEQLREELTDLFVDLKRLRTERVNIDVDSDAQTVEAEINRLLGELEFLAERTTSLPVILDDDEFQFTLKALKLELAAFTDELTIDASVDIDGLAEAIVELEALKAEAARLEETINLDAEADTAAAQADLLTLQALITAVEARINVQAEVDIGAAISQLLILNAAKEVAEADVDIQVDVDAAGAIAQLGAVTGAAASAQSASSAFAQVQQGLGGVAGVAPIAAIAGAIAAIGPLVPGIVGAGVAFLGLGAAAGVAAGGLAAFAVLTNDAAKAQIGAYFSELKAGIETTLAPAVAFITTQAVPAFFSIANSFVSAVGPAVLGAIAPVTESLLALFSSLGTAIQPLIQPIADGLASFIDTIGTFLPALTPVAASLTGPFFNALNGIVELLLGTASAAAPIWVGFLDAIGNGARALIGPLTAFTQQFIEAFTAEGVSSGIGNLLSELGTLFLGLGATVAELAASLGAALGDIGVENLLVLVSGVAAVLGGPAFLAIPALFLFITDAASGIGELVQGLAPFLGLVGEVIRTVIAGVADLFNNYVAAIDFESLQAAFLPIAAGVRGLLPILRAAIGGIGQVYGAVVNGLLSLGPPIISFFFGTLLPAIGGFVGGAGRFIATLIRGFGSFVEYISGPVIDAIVGLLGPLRNLPVVGDLIGGALDLWQDSKDALISGTETAATAVENITGGAEAFLTLGADQITDLMEKVESGELTFAEALDALTGGATAAAGALVETGDRILDHNYNLEKLNAEYAAGKIDLETYQGALEELASKTFPATSKAITALREEDISSLFKAATEAAKKFASDQNEANQKAAEATRSGVQAIVGRGRLADFIREEGNKASDAARDAAEQTRQAVQDVLRLGKLGDFLDDEFVEIDRALFDFTENFRLRVQNIRRLQQLSNLGFGALAVQLATITNPQSLSAAIDQFSARGFAGLADANGQIVAVTGELQQALAGLDPALAAALGTSETQKAVEEQKRSVFGAIDSYVASIQTKIRNARRLAFLQSAGFGALVVQLGTISDPEELRQKLDELSAAGTGAIRAQNSKVEAANRELAEVYAQLDPTTAAAIGVEQTVAKLDEGNVTVADALTQFSKIVQAKITAVNKLLFLEALAPNLAGALASIYEGDPEGLSRAIDELFGRGAEAIAFGEGIVTQQFQQVQDAADRATAATQARLGEVPTAAAQAIQDFVTQSVQGLPATAETAATGAVSATTAAAGQAFDATGAALAPKVNDLGVQTGNDFAAAFVGAVSAALNDGSLAQAVQDGLLGQRFLFTNTRIGGVAAQFRTAGTDIGIQFADAVVSDAVTRITAGLGLVAPIGLLIGVGVGASVATGLSSTAPLVAVAATGISTAVLTAFAPLLQFAQPLGSTAASLLSVGFSTGFALSVATIDTAIRTAFGRIGENLFAIARSIGTLAAFGLGAQFVAGLTSPVIVTGINAAIQQISTILVDGLTIVGLNAGGDLVAGIQFGIALASPALIAQTLQLATSLGAIMRAALQINSPSGVGIDIGDQFVAGIVAGLAASQNRLVVAAGTLRDALVTTAAEPVEFQTSVAAPAGVIPQTGVAGIAPGAATENTALLQQMLFELQAQNAELRAAAARPLIGEYNVTTTREPQSPDQLATDAAFAKALLL